MLRLPYRTGAGIYLAVKIIYRKVTGAYHTLVEFYRMGAGVYLQVKCAYHKGALAYRKVNGNYLKGDVLYH